MKSIIRMTALLLVLVSTPLLATESEDVSQPPELELAFSGAWEGIGYLSDINDHGVPCEKIRFEFEQTEHSLLLKQGSYECSGVNFAWKQVKINIDSGDLVLDNQVLGEIGPKSFAMDLGVIVPDMVWTLKGELVDGQLILKEVQSTDLVEIRSYAELKPVE